MALGCMFGAHANLWMSTECHAFVKYEVWQILRLISAQEEGANEDKICEHKFRKDKPEPHGHAGVVHEDKSSKNAPMPPAGAPRAATGPSPAKAAIGAILSKPEDMDRSDTDNAQAAGPNAVAGGLSWQPTTTCN
ncbi:hypothetical protein DFH07DRAFT_950507 [Mycena maculata]|uniref:Uncharacterized protein n=1 Tax=Mycena maculata TaxID=230809 RepID=A0AAD7K6L9_9AGAR|nr:hypothetical protein DFH07DRAFT_950507 [Mycena maculata]